MRVLSYSIISVLLLAALCSSCKKKETAPNEPEVLVEQPDFTLEAADVNYHLGTTWVYKMHIYTETFTSGQTGSTMQQSTDTYTVIAMYDSLMPNNVTGKVVQYFFSNNSAGPKELQYVDNVTNQWHNVLFGAGIIPSGITVQLPLTTSSRWKNPYYPSQSSVDTCAAMSYENLITEVGYLKCIKYKALNIENTYCYNKRMGRTYLETHRLSSLNWPSIVSQTIQTTLIKFY